MFELIPAIAGILAGMMCISFPTRIVSMNKRISLKSNDAINKNIAAYPKEKGKRLIILIGVFLIIISSLKLFLLFGEM